VVGLGGSRRSSFDVVVGNVDGSLSFSYFFMHDSL